MVGASLAPLDHLREGNRSGEAAGGSRCIKLFGLWPEITCRMVTEL